MAVEARVSPSKNEHARGRTMKMMCGALLGVFMVLSITPPTQAAIAQLSVPETGKSHLNPTRKVVMPGYAVRARVDNAPDVGAAADQDITEVAWKPSTKASSRQLRPITRSSTPVKASREAHGWMGDEGVKIQGRWMAKQCYCRRVSVKRGTCYVFTKKPFCEASECECEARYCAPQHTCVNPLLSNMTCVLHHVRKQVVPTGEYHCKQKSIDGFKYVPTTESKDGFKYVPTAA